MWVGVGVGMGVGVSINVSVEVCIDEITFFCESRNRIFLGFGVFFGISVKRNQ